MENPDRQTAKRAHHCPDWDFAFIRPGDPEMECCICGGRMPDARKTLEEKAADE